jgi:hypothetical protein
MTFDNKIFFGNTPAAQRAETIRNSGAAVARMGEIVLAHYGAEQT